MPYTLSGAIIVMTPDGKQEFPWATRVKQEKDGTLHIYGALKRHHVLEPHEWTAFLAAKRNSTPERKAITAGDL
jgi:hypothetical protein